MKTIRSDQRIGAAILALCLAMLACNALNFASVGDLTTNTQSVDLGSASSASVRIEFGAGRLKVEGGADQLAQVSYETNVTEWEPQVDYSVTGGLGKLVVSHESDNLPVGKEVINEWTIQLNNKVPLDLEIATGAGESELNLSQLDLSSVRIETGAGSTNVDLNGSWDHDVAATITGGVGELIVRLPAKVGVRVDVATGLTTVTASGLNKDGDSYVNQAYGSAANNLTLEVESGVGTVKLVVP